MSSRFKVYLGDGAYADYDEQTDQVVLTAEDGIRATDMVYLEPHVLASFLRFVEGLKKVLAAESKARATKTATSP